MTELNTETEPTAVADAPVVDTPQASIEGQAPLDTDWQNLWFSLQRTPWAALAVVPADSGLDVREVAEAIVELGHMSGAASLRYLNATGAGFAESQDMVEGITASTRRGYPVVVACDAIEDNPATLALAKAAKHVVMVVRLGQSRIAAARKTIDAVGREHVLAAVTLRPRR